MNQKKDKQTIKGRRTVESKVGKTICTNRDCRLRAAGCKGFDGCPGYKTI